MSKRKAASGAKKRKPYQPPAIKKLSLEDAKSALEARSVAGDKQAKELLNEINRRLEGESK